MTAAEAIREARRLAGISQEELARRLGHKRPGTVSTYELGKKQPGVVAFAAILDACEVSCGHDAAGWFVCRQNELSRPMVTKRTVA
jgi:transcriptional regulator with XRE-family HTH domain